MYKNQLQELAQRSCFNLPSYKCIREGPDHAPRFKAVVNFNGENFESPTFCTTLRQAEHSAAEVALNALSKQGPSRTLAARVLDETGVYKNLLQETAHRAGLNLPVYTTLRSGPGHTPAFTCTVELAGLSFVGDPAKTKKKAEKNAALAAWSALKQLPQHGSSLPHGSENNEEQEQVVVARALAKLRSVDASKLYSLNDRSYGRRKAAPIWDDMNPANGALLHSVSVPYQSWVPSNLLPNLEMPQLWQDHSPRHLSHLRALPSPSPSPANDSRNVPCIQPTIGSAQGHYFPAVEQDHLDSCLTKLDSSSLFFSSYPSLVPPGGSSQVCIQEIQDEKTMRNEGKLDSGVSEVDRSIELNFQEFLKDKEGYVLPSSSGMPSEEENNKQIPGYTPVSNDCNSFVIPKSRSSRNVPDIQQGTGGCNSFELLLSGSTFSGPSSPNQLSFMPKNSGVFKSAQSVSNLHHRHSASCSLGFPQGSQHPNVAAQRPSRTAVPVRASPRIDAFRARDSFLASPVNIRTAIPVCSARPRGTPSLPSAVAPAVHVRSVTPVCSARPGGMNSSPSMSRAVAPAIHIRSVTHVCSARPGGTNSSQSLPVAVAPAVHVRSVTPVSSARPGGMNSSSFPSLPSPVVPAVHLKSVVPVCSAPTVKLPTSVEITAQELKDISTPTGRFGKLHI